MHDCAALPSPLPSEYVDFSSNTLFQKASTLLRDNLSSEKINSLIDSLTTKQSGVAGRLQVTSELLAFQYDATSLGIGLINASVSGIVLDGINSVFNSSLLAAVSPYAVLTAVGMGAPSPVTFKVDFALDIHGGPVTISDHFPVSLTMLELILSLLARLKIPTSALEQLVLGSALQPACWLATIESNAMLLNATFEDFGVALGCSEATCSSTGLVQLAKNLQSPFAKGNLTEHLNNFLEQGTHILANDAHDYIQNAHFYCAGEKPPRRTDTHTKDLERISLTFIGAGAAICGLFAAVLCGPRIWRRCCNGKKEREQNKSINVPNVRFNDEREPVQLPSKIKLNFRSPLDRLTPGASVSFKVPKLPPIKWYV